jgi:hypothetical protein
MLEVQQSTTDMAGMSRLEQIRASMSGAPIAGGQQAPQVGQGEAQQQLPSSPAPAQQQNTQNQQQPGTA